jgi:hypothetical protein
MGVVTVFSASSYHESPPNSSGILYISKGGGIDRIIFPPISRTPRSAAAFYTMVSAADGEQSPSSEESRKLKHGVSSRHSTGSVLLSAGPRQFMRRSVSLRPHATRFPNLCPSGGAMMLGKNNPRVGMMTEIGDVMKCD